MLKRVMKQIISAFFILLVLPVFCLYWCLSLIAARDQLISAFSQFFSLFPGKTGSYIRSAFFKLALSHCDTDLFIGFGSLFSQQDTELYQGVYIGPQCNIGRCRIEANCLLGSGVHIMSGKGQHNFADLDTPLKDQGGSLTKIVIGEDSWIGNGALIMANVGKKCIVAAGSVVINDVADFSIVGGNPAKLLKTRK